MKNNFVLIILLASLNAFAVHGDPSGDCDIHCLDQKKIEAAVGKPTIPGERTIAGITGKLRTDEYAALGDQLCNLYNNSPEFSNTALGKIKRHFKLYKLGEPTIDNMLKYMNENKDEIKCGKHNWLKQSIAAGKHRSVFKTFLLEHLITDDEYIDVNGVDYHNGIPETTLDYLDRQIAERKKAGYTEVALKPWREFRAFLVHEEEGFAAKKFNELPLEVRQQYRVQFARK